ncbi:uncharacterized protein LOC129898946 isoform X2 [Solanum dulcamara]|uniref:uncharacterized protein LOC129898946 isoform X2 n=1 Tax=Solanum dulcamara TaxID=45834 RepID=UPI002484E8C8|nr:uncharacterized protein LOC129898946 isoform X2 [Solanum dulcamara]
MQEVLRAIVTLLLEMENLWRRVPSQYYLNVQMQSFLLGKYSQCKLVSLSTFAIDLYSLICAYTNRNILIFSLGHVTLLDWITSPGTGSLRDLPHSTPAVKSEEEDSGGVICKKMIISLLEKLEYYDVVILKIPILVQLTSFIVSLIDMYTKLEAMVHVKAIFYD